MVVWVWVGGESGGVCACARAAASARKGGGVCEREQRVANIVRKPSRPDRRNAIALGVAAVPRLDASAAPDI